MAIGSHGGGIGEVMNFDGSTYSMFATRLMMGAVGKASRSFLTPLLEYSPSSEVSRIACSKQASQAARRTGTHRMMRCEQLE